MSELLEALYRGDRNRVDEVLAGDPELDVFEAAALGRSDRLGRLLEQDASRANAFGDDGFHPLGLACFFGHVDAARVLLAHGADANLLSRNEHIQTAAIHAAAASNEEASDEATRYELVKLGQAYLALEAHTVARTATRRSSSYSSSTARRPSVFPTPTRRAGRRRAGAARP